MSGKGERGGGTISLGRMRIYDRVCRIFGRTKRTAARVRVGAALVISVTVLRRYYGRRLGIGSP